MAVASLARLMLVLEVSVAIGVMLVVVGIEGLPGVVPPRLEPRPRPRARFLDPKTLGEFGWDGGIEDSGVCKGVSFGLVSLGLALEGPPGRLPRVAPPWWPPREGRPPLGPPRFDEIRGGMSESPKLITMK